MAAIAMRPPTFSTMKPPPEYKSPSIAWLTEEWHVTHSTLPLWKSKRNVRIKYTPLEPSSAAVSKKSTDRIDDVVSYQSLKDTKVDTVRGLDKCASRGGDRDAWDWRGRGLLVIASSHWEVLGWGEEEGTGNKWVVTMFAKTLFTPAGIDVYSRNRTGVKSETLADLKEALTKVQDKDVQKMVGQLFEVTVDNARPD